MAYAQLNQTIAFRVTSKEKLLLRKLAREADKKPSQYYRELIMGAANRKADGQ